MYYISNHSPFLLETHGLWKKRESYLAGSPKFRIACLKCCVLPPPRGVSILINSFSMGLPDLSGLASISVH